MKKVALLSVVLSMMFGLYAADIPLDPFSDVPTSTRGAVEPENTADMKVAIPVGVENNPFYHCLQVLNLQERQNARIEIMFMSDVSKDIGLYARSIEQTWNSGDFDTALEMFEQLNAMPEMTGNVVIGIMWRTPIPAPISDWGDDVQISTRDSVFVLAMDRDNATDHLFAMIGFTGDGQGSRYTGNFSSDGGATWSETYALGGFGYVMNDLDACACDGYFWVAYTGGIAGNSMCWLKRFQASNGAPVDMPNGSSTYNLFTQTLPDTIMDLEITSNHDQWDNRLYVMGIIKNGTIRAFWGYTDQVNWTEYTTVGITDARQGLDANWNNGYSDHFLLMSYINDADEVVLYGKAVDWDEIYSYGIINTYGYYTTACGGWQDTLFFTFNYTGTAVQARYLVRYGIGGSWFYGFLAADTTVNNFTPDVTLRNGGGTHGCYRGPNTSAAYYRFRGYSGTWSTAEEFNDHTVSGNVRMEIENVGGGNYGILYRTPMSSVGICYFDRSDWSPGVSEYKDENAFASFINLAPNPVRDLTRLSFVTQTNGRVKVTLYDIAGRSVEDILDASMEPGTHAINIETHNLAAGIYFVRIDAPDGTGSRTMTIVR
ncbi:MAG: T9SS type A sorting domain-containing protein [candidate division WOR-3 bacterium]|nr:MAG: T9SS type A sorting domain-containing protein [candidate division WOR-3 bacterium]